MTPLSPYRILAASGVFALMGLGFLVAAVVVLRLPGPVLPAPPPLPAAEAHGPPGSRQELRYIAMRAPITVADHAGALSVEIGVAVAAADEDVVRHALREDVAPARAALTEAAVQLAARTSAAGQDRAALRALLPVALRDVLNARFAAEGLGQPVLEVFVVDFFAR